MGDDMSVRERLLDSTIALIRRKGVAGTGIADLLEHSGVSRRSVYLNFPGGKAEMVAAATRRAGASTSTVLRSATRDLSDPLGDFLQFWLHRLAHGTFLDGCPVVAATLGRDEAPAAADAAGQAFSEWTDALGERFVNAGAPVESARPLAATVIAAFEGAAVMSLAQHSEQPLRDIHATLTPLVLAATGVESDQHASATPKE